MTGEPNEPRRRPLPVPIFAAVLAVVTVVLIVVAIAVAVPGSDTGALPAPTASPTPEPSPPASAEPIPEAVAIAFSRPIRPEERPGDTQVVAVPSPGQVEAEGRKDWPEAAFGVWTECTDLLDRKQFDQAISRMNTVTTRSTDPGVRAVTATCRAAAKVNNGDVAEVGPDLDEARRRADSLPPQAQLDVTFTTDLTDVTRLMINLGQASSVASAAKTSRIQAEIARAASRVDREMSALARAGSADPSTRVATSIGIGCASCWGNGSARPCQEVAVATVTALPSLPSGLRTGVMGAIAAISPGPGNGPNPPVPAPSTTPTGTAVPTTTADSTTPPRPTTSMTTVGG
jgi:hypothetical protein